MKFTRVDDQFQILFACSEHGNDLEICDQDAANAFLQAMVLRCLFRGTVIIRNDNAPKANLLSIPSDRGDFLATVAQLLLQYDKDINHIAQKFFHWHASSYAELASEVTSFADDWLEPRYSKQARLQFQCKLETVMYYDILLVSPEMAHVSLDLAVDTLNHRLSERVPEFTKMAAEQRKREAFLRENMTVPESTKESFKFGDKVWLDRSIGECLFHAPAVITSKMYPDIPGSELYEVHVDLTPFGFNMVIPNIIARAGELERRN